MKVEYFDHSITTEQMFMIIELDQQQVIKNETILIGRRVADTTRSIIWFNII